MSETHPTLALGFARVLLGRAVSARFTGDAPWLDALLPLLDPFPAVSEGPVPAPAVEILASADGTQWLVRASGDEAVFDAPVEVARQVEWGLFAAAVYDAPLPLCLHAGAVARDGGVLLLPAESGAGKTTLTLALAARGWLPLTDDLCPLDERDGAMVALPCPRCCHVSHASQAALAARGVALDGPVGGVAEYYRPLAWGQSAPLRWIVAPRYEAGAPLAIEPLSQAATAALILHGSFTHAGRGGRDQWPAALAIGREVRGYRLTYSDLAAAFDAIDAIARGAPP